MAGSGTVNHPQPQKSQRARINLGLLFGPRAVNRSQTCLIAVMLTRLARFRLLLSSLLLSSTSTSSAMRFPSLSQPALAPSSMG
ncbi:uncharacterized protein BDV17DRAFT_16037 [Aspergillus undulatus]|uniref:uncharacterized protein n=1 Tax=Aspergillus undulatus TaxID=1810928 RepID=UPI003CCD2E24